MVSKRDAFSLLIASFWLLSVYLHYLGFNLKIVLWFPDISRLAQQVKVRQRFVCHFFFPLNVFTFCNLLHSVWTHDMNTKLFLPHIKMKRTLVTGVLCILICTRKLQKNSSDSRDWPLQESNYPNNFLFNCPPFTNQNQPLYLYTGNSNIQD